MAARYLGIDWDLQQLHIVEAIVDQGRLRMQKALCWDESVSPNPAQAQEAGQRLKARLKEAGIAPAPVLFVIGRDRVLFREVRYPQVPPEEEAALVQFQAAKELTFPVEEAAIDYAPSALSGPLGERRALAVILRKELLNAIKDACHSAGLKLESLTPRPFALLAGWRSQPHLPGDDEAHAILITGRGRAELGVVRGNELLFGRALSNGNGEMSAEQLLSEVRRSLAAYESQHPQHSVRTVHVAGLKGATLSGLRMPVKTYDPVGQAGNADMSADERMRFGAVMGMLQARAAHRRLAVDFMHAKEPPSTRPAWKRYAIAAGIGLGVLVLGGGVLYSLASSARDDRIAELSRDKTTLQKQIDSFGDVDKRMEKLNEWASAEVVVLDELYELFARFPDMPGVRITKVTVTPAAETTGRPAPARTPAAPIAGKPAPKPATRPVATLTIEATGAAEALDRLQKALDGGHWKLDLWEPLPSGRRLHVKLFGQRPTDYTTTLTPPVNRSTPAPNLGGRP